MILVTKHKSFCKFVALKKRAVTRSKTKARQSHTKKNPWIWILCGALVGVLISSSIFIKFNSASQSPKIKQLSNAKNTNSNVKSKKTTKATKFEFYTVLPTMETGSAVIEQPKQKIIAAPTKYLLQVKIFNEIDTADELKAKLTLAGFDAKIEPIKKDNGTWYRIVMGPFNSEQQASEQQRLLAKQNISSNVLKQ